ncbi:MAG: DUF4445 domain-containing protein [Candidatus Omnitrophica bacterium]|nr:DUF4445 domain-containing protein [Candidatus Omnitrophota bacterium]
MTAKVRIDLTPVGDTFEVKKGTPLRDFLFDRGVEFPCGGRGECRGCRVRVAEGHLPLTDVQASILSEREIEQGWRVSCQCRAETDLTLELRGWNADILQDRTLFDFTPGEGLGVAVDIGTTTVAVQLLDLSTANVLGVRSALNIQARHGADVMSRVAYSLTPEGNGTLTASIREQIGRLIRDLLKKSERTEGMSDTLSEIILVGNTAMHHLFCGLDVEPLSAYPFEPSEDGLKEFASDRLGWDLPGAPTVRFLPCLGGFVGSDLLAGVLATKLHRSQTPTALIDLGTNGEIIVCAGEKILCASTAAGPAFEGAKISHGMRAAHGAIYKVSPTTNGYDCHILGDTEPRGICGSGLVDAVASALDKGDLKPNGRVVTESRQIPLAGEVFLRQCDIRQLQLAKGAIAAGVRILCKRIGIEEEDLETVYLAGAFGNFIDHQSAERIGLLKFPSDKIHPIGNSALLGAKIALFDNASVQQEIASILERMDHVTLSSDMDFQEIYADEMGFPTASNFP